LASGEWVRVTATGTFSPLMDFSALAGGFCRGRPVTEDAATVGLCGGSSRVPLLIPAPIGIGPEVPPEAFEALAAAIARALPGCGSAPLVLADRGVGALVQVDGPSSRLDEFASEAALALETISGYTDVVHAARRHKPPRPAAEMQQDLLPPRIARVSGADLAGGVLPGYDVGATSSTTPTTTRACGSPSPTRSARKTRQPPSPP
jgi:hypothetical protein